MATDTLLAILCAADRDRYLAALYAPQEKREALAALYAFNAEIASVRDRVSQPLAGEIRLQWWRDLIMAGEAAPGHPVADALLAAIERHRLPRSTFDDYLSARIFDLYDDPMPTRLDLEGYCGETAAALIQLSALVLDPDAAPACAEAAGRAGCAQAIAGLLRLLPLHLSRGQCFLPRDLLAAAGTRPEDFVAGRAGEAAERAVLAMVSLGEEHLSAFSALAPAVPASVRPAFLPLALTSAYLGAVKRRPAEAMVRPAEIGNLRRHWLMLRRASKGWPET